MKLLYGIELAQLTQMRSISYILILATYVMIQPAWATPVVPPEPWFGSLIELPKYTYSDDEFGPQKEGLRDTLPSWDYFNSNYSQCSGTSNFPFQKSGDNVAHTNFPYVAATPVLEDRASTYFFKEISTGKFYNAKWSTAQFPIIFHLTQVASQEKYKTIILKALQYINEKAVAAGIVPAGKKLVAASPEVKTPDDESCSLHLIHFDKTLVPGKSNEGTNRGSAFVKYDDLHADRLGEIVDADVVIAIGNIEDMDSDESKDQQKLLTFATITHEILHAMGLDHNFAFGTVMDYETQPNQNLRDLSLSYEMDALAYLYQDKIPSKNWPMIRTTNANATYKPDTQPFWVSKKWYQAELVDDSKKFVCTSKTGKQEKADFSHLVPNTFKVQLEYNGKPFVEYSYTRFKIEGLISNIFNIESLIDIGRVQRLFPVMSFEDLDYIDTNNNSTRTSIKLTTNDHWVFPSPFVQAYASNGESDLDWKFTIISNAASKNYSTLECDFKARFKIQN